MAGKYGSASAICLVDGYDFLSAKLQTLTLKIMSITETTDGLGDAYEAHSPVGKQQAALTQSGGFFDTATAGLHAAMAAGTPSTPQATVRIVCIGAQGQTAGAVFWGIQGAFTVAYEVVLELSKLTKANVAYLMTGLVERGMIVQPLATKIADWNTKTLGTQIDYTLDPSQVAIPITSATKANPCIVTTTVPHGLTTGDIVLISGNTLAGPSINSENGAVTVLSTTTFDVGTNTSGSTGAGTGGSFVRSNSSGGAAGYQQVTAWVAGFTSFTGKLRDSADDITYADLITFASVTSAPTKERATVAGVVDRYVSYDGDFIGGANGSITLFAGLARL